MRDDQLIEFVVGKCELLKRSSMWPGQPRMNPGPWLRNFDKPDQIIAALLLDRFIFYNDESTNLLLKASWNSIADGLSKGGALSSRDELLNSLKTAYFVPVEGEAPNPTDSGYLFCRKARQILRIPDERFITTKEALSQAIAGNTLVFLDDFVGSGDQFIKTWTRPLNQNGESFSVVQESQFFTAIYLTLITTDFGLDNIINEAPSVAVCPTHIITKKSTIQGLVSAGVFDRDELSGFLEKYCENLRPKEAYMQNCEEYLKYGYKKRGLLMGFEHSIPDATMPIFWSPGLNNWEPLIERT